MSEELYAGYNAEIGKAVLANGTYANLSSNQLNLPGAIGQKQGDLAIFQSSPIARNRQTDRRRPIASKRQLGAAFLYTTVARNAGNNSPVKAKTYWLRLSTRSAPIKLGTVPDTIGGCIPGLDDSPDPPIRFARCWAIYRENFPVSEYKPGLPGDIRFTSVDTLEAPTGGYGFCPGTDSCFITESSFIITPYAQIPSQNPPGSSLSVFDPVPYLDVVAESDPQWLMFPMGIFVPSDGQVSSYMAYIIISSSTATLPDGNALARLLATNESGSVVPGNGTATPGRLDGIPIATVPWKLMYDEQSESPKQRNGPIGPAPSITNSARSFASANNKFAYANLLDLPSCEAGNYRRKAIFRLAWQENKPIELLETSDMQGNWRWPADLPNIPPLPNACANNWLTNGFANLQIRLPIDADSDGKVWLEQRQLAKLQEQIVGNMPVIVKAKTKPICSSEDGAPNGLSSKPTLLPTNAQLIGLAIHPL